jgi:RHS repeat-associated protein
VSYGYDALGRLVSSTASSGTTTSLSYLGTGQTIASDGTDLYSYDPSGDATAAEAVSGGTGEAVMTDQHGDITAAFSPASTTSSLAGYATYSPYGAVTSSGGTMPGIGYQGDYTDPTTGLVHMGARWYNPSTGAFTSSDTISSTPVPSTVDGNPYAYADGNPLTETDPSGHLCLVCDVETGLRWGESAAADAAGVSWEEAPELDVMAVAGYYSYEEAHQIADALAQAPLDLIQELEGCAVGCGYDYDPSGGSTGTGPAPCNIACGGPPILGLEPGWGQPSIRSTISSGPSPSAGPGPGPCGYVACPPPPPPPDCYAGPHPTCKPQAPPGSLLHDEIITNLVKNITSYPDLCKLGLCITEKNKPKQGPVKGTTPSNTGTPGNGGNGDQNDQELLHPARDQGIPPTPTAGGTSGGNIGKGGGGNPPTENGDACGPGDGSPPRFVASKQGIIDTQSPALQQQISNVVNALSETGSPPPGVRQGGLPGKPGVYGNRSGELPAQPEGYYTESDVWPGPGPRGTERIVVGDGGEVWYTPDHYGNFRSWPPC